MTPHGSQLSRRQFLKTAAIIGGTFAAASSPVYFPIRWAAAEALIDPRLFVASEVGSGAFGRWILDTAGLPAYSYEIDQYQDTRARYPNSLGRDRRDHWHQIGNDRVTGLASNDGIVQLYMADRGGVFLNRFESESETVDPGTRHAYSGGFSYLSDGQQTWATAFRYRPADAQTRRIFGMGYFETEMVYRHIRSQRRVYAPYGDVPLLLIDEQLENLGPTAIDLQHYEYWDVNVHQLKLQWSRAGLFAASGDGERRALNDRFKASIAWQDEWQGLRFQQRALDDAPLPDELNGMVDRHPSDIFLADLSGSSVTHYVDKFAFFGQGGPRQPTAIHEQHSSANDEMTAQPGDSMPYCMVIRHDLHLEPSASVRLRHAYGVVHPDQPLTILDSYRTDQPLQQTLAQWKKQLAYFSTGADPVLQRETTWHAYNLLSATVYNEYSEMHLVPQGSAYLYLHGADGASRDQSLFTLPLVYVRPTLAREILQALMSLTQAAIGLMPYAFSGNGHLSDAVGYHAQPSDLDLFFLLAICEYLAATGDTAFLDVEVPFYPRGAQPTAVSGSTVLDHVRLAVLHLLEKVGIGDHGLVKIGDGDWSDGIVLRTALAKGSEDLASRLENTKQNGESVLNTQMALYILPQVAAMLAQRDRALADRIDHLLPGLRKAAQVQWQGQWYGRAILRDALNQPIEVGKNKIDLEAQPWALISGLTAENGVEAALIKSITCLLDDPSPIGAPLVENGEVWPAISQLLTWGYRRSRPDLAWRSLQRHSYAQHATIFPNVWNNIWSGPDGVKTNDPLYSGGAWNSLTTPMIDFPVMNANQDAMALLALIRVCGIEPSPNGDGLIIAPKAPPERFVLDTQLLRLEVEPHRIAGEYRPIADGKRVLHVRLPKPATQIDATISGTPIKATPQHASQIDLQLSCTAEQPVTFEVRWQ